MRVEVNRVGNIGVIRDLFSLDTPPEAWGQAVNVRMGPAGAEAFLGHTTCLNTSTSAGWTQQPYWLQYVPVSSGNGYWVGAGSTKCYARLATSPYTETNITRQSGGVDVNYAATQDAKWQGAMFSSILLLNNGVDVPQVWTPVAGATKLQNLQAFGSSPWDSNHRCAHIAPFLRFLVALDITKSGTRYPLLVKWSHPADPNSMPSSWNAADPAVDAGEYPLSDASGELVDQLVLGDTNFLYTTDQIIAMNWVGGGDVFGFKPRFREQGALAQHCVARFRSKGAEMHLVLGGDDLFVHNGQAANSIIDPQMRRWFLQQINPSYYHRSFVVANPRYSEMWVCVPENGMEQPTLALVWNWQTGAIGFRELFITTVGTDTKLTAGTRGTPCIAPGFVEEIVSPTWASVTTTWDSDYTTWNSPGTSPAIPRLVGIERSAYNIAYLLDSGFTYHDVAVPVTLERIGLAIAGQDRQGNPTSDSSTIKTLYEVWPRFSGNPGTVTISAGFQNHPDEAVTWVAAGSYTPNSSSNKPCLDTFYSGRYLSVRFTFNASAAAALVGYGLELEPAGALP